MADFLTSLHYLEDIQRCGYSPNFWMSGDFLVSKELEWVEKSCYVGFVEPNTPGWFLPPIGVDGQARLDANIWAGVDGATNGEFLDYEFIYDPLDFLDISGGKWKVFRKNVKKWPNRVDGDIGYYKLDGDEDLESCLQLLVEWADGQPIYDPDTVARLCASSNFRFGLYLDGELVGLNVCDMNWEFVNFRLCIDNGDPFIQEYLRYRFYTSEFVQMMRNRFGLLVNDGGSLGKPGLERFKRKLNPVEVRSIYSLRG